MSTSISGLELSRAFYFKGVLPILREARPKLRYAAGLIGSGSEVLGYDDHLSTDHNWGPRLVLILPSDRFSIQKKLIKRLLQALPSEILGYPTKYEKFKELAVQGSRQADWSSAVEIYSVHSFFRKYLGVNSDMEISVGDWLCIPQHKLLTLRGGEIFHDKIRFKTHLRKYRYFPRDVWLYLLASQWIKVSQEEAFVGRCGDTGDELGSRLIAANLVEELIYLCFLYEKKFIPYKKWLGKAFRELDCAKKLSPIFEDILDAQDWKPREDRLARAYRVVARIHNKAKITSPLKAEVTKYYDRPYRVIHAGRFATAIKRKIRSATIRENLT